MQVHGSTSANRPSASSGLPVEWVVRLQDRFQAMYGEKFSRQFQTERDNAAWLEAWGVGLADLDAGDLKEGLRRCLNESSWPPSLPEFRAMCSKKSSRPEHQRYLPAPKDTKDRSAEIAQIMAMLTKKRAA